MKTVYVERPTPVSTEGAHCKRRSHVTRILPLINKLGCEGAVASTMIGEIEASNGSPLDINWALRWWSEAPVRKVTVCSLLYDQSPDHIIKDHSISPDSMYDELVLEDNLRRTWDWFVRQVSNWSCNQIPLEGINCKDQLYEFTIWNCTTVLWSDEANTTLIKIKNTKTP